MFPNYGNYYNTKQCLPNCPSYMYQDKQSGDVIVNPNDTLIVNGNTIIRGTLNMDAAEMPITNSNNDYSNVVFDASNHVIRYKMMAYGTFISDSSQNITQNNVTEMRYSTTKSFAKNIELAYDASLSSYSHIKPLVSGVYKIGTSIQLTQSAGGTNDVNIWFRKNGVNIPSSSSIIRITGNGAYQIVYVEIIETFSANDKIEIMVGTTGAGIVATHYGPQTFNGITSPDAPAIITTVILIS